MPEYILEMTGIVKEFSGVRALNDANFSLKKGEVHALLGINGAGKSTLIKVISGVNPIDGGQIKINGRSITINGPQDAKKFGIATVYQAPQMIPSFTGYENVFLGNESEEGSKLRYINRKKLKEKAYRILDKFPIELDLNSPVVNLEPVERECIAILRALVQQDISILILDEPTSILSRKEVDILFSLIEALKAEGVAIIYITHRLNEVFKICDRYTIFRNGQHIATHSCEEKNITHNDIAEMMLNESLSQLYPQRCPEYGKETFVVKNLSSKGNFYDVSFSVHEKEIVGIFGLVGSGIDELSKALFGAIKTNAGSICLKGKILSLASCADAIKEGIFLVPGDRHKEGYIGEENISFNITLSRLSGVSRLGILKPKLDKTESITLIDMFELRPRDPNYIVASLSGGNQQKVVMAKGIYTNSDVYLFSEPTSGVDIGAKSLIYQRIRELSKDKSTVVISSDCEEVYGLSDRIIIFYKGRIVLNKRTEDMSLDDALVSGLTGRVA